MYKNNIHNCGKILNDQFSVALKEDTNIRVFSNEVLFIARKLTTKVTATDIPKIHKQFMN
jgi:hypothetical protein